MNRSAWQHDDERIIETYKHLVETYGFDHRALDWGSRYSQELRFAVLTEIAPLQEASVLDVGCGLADFLDYLQRRGIGAQYTGYDLTPGMIAVASRRFPGAQLHVVNLLNEPEPTPQFDYVVASGIFHLRQHDPFSYLESMVHRMFALCHRGVAFNTLSCLAKKRDPGEFYAEPARVMALCLEITPFVVMRHDYLEHDFTVYLYRNHNDRHH